MIQVIAERKWRKVGQPMFRTYRFDSMEAAGAFIQKWNLNVFDIIY